MDRKKENIDQACELLVKVGAILFNRNLTDLAGGNISLRVGDKVIMSPGFSATYKFWELNPEDVLIFNLKGKKLKGKGKISREAKTHLLLINRFYPYGKAVIHAHPIYRFLLNKTSE